MYLDIGTPGKSLVQLRQYTCPSPQKFPFCHPSLPLFPLPHHHLAATDRLSVTLQ